MEEGAQPTSHISLMTVLIALGVVILTGNPAVAFLIGALYSLIGDRPSSAKISKVGTYCLQIGIVLLGLKLNAGQVLFLTREYSVVVGSYVLLTMGAGLVIGKMVRNTDRSSQLITSGTAICGGTAVATLSPVIGAKSEETGVALGLIFILNSLALFTFPFVGEYLQMTQEQFGVWIALSVHDTSSVVATGTIFGEEAMKVATTVKLGRTLWLIPLIFLFSTLQKKKGANVRVPFFIVLFLLTASVGSFISVPEQILVIAGKLTNYLLVMALFFVGSSLTRSAIKNLKGAALIQGLLLWAVVIPSTLLFVISLAV